MKESPAPQPLDRAGIFPCTSAKLIGVGVSELKENHRGPQRLDTALHLIQTKFPIFKRIQQMAGVVTLIGLNKKVKNHGNLGALDRARRVPIINRNKMVKNHGNLLPLDRADSDLFARAVEKNRFLDILKGGV